MDDMKVKASPTPAPGGRLAAVACAFMALLFPPLVILALNGGTLRLPSGSILAGGTPVVLLAAVGLYLLTRLPRLGGWVVEGCRLATLALFVLTVFPNATGEMVGTGRFLAGADNALPLFKLVNLLALLLLLRWRKRALFDTMHGFSLAAAGLLSLAIVLGLRMGGREQEMSAAFRAQAARLAPAGNVVVVVPDAFTGYRMAEVLSADPDLRNRFKGFTLYPNAVASAFNTLAGISALLTGDLEVACDPAVKRRRIERMLEESWLREARDLTNRAVYFGYLFPEQTDIETVDEQRYFDTALLPTADGRRHYRLLLALSVARLLPPAVYHALADSILPPAIQARGCGPDAVRRAYRQATHVCERSAYASELAFQHLMEQLHVAPGPPIVLFFHSQLTHAPSVSDAAGNVGQEHDVAGTMTYATRLLAQLCDRLRQLEVYDSTLIIVASDHGFSPPDDPTMGGVLDEGQRLDPVYNSLMMVKPAGATNPCVAHPMPVWLGDVAATVREHLGAPPGAPKDAVRSLLRPGDAQRRLRLPLYVHPDQAGFHSSLAQWHSRLVEGGIAAFAQASSAPLPLRWRRGAVIRVAAGLDKRRMEGIARGWLLATGVQMRVAIEVDEQLAIKRSAPGGVVAMRASGADESAEILETPATIRSLLADLPSGHSLVVGGVGLSRADIGYLLPPDRANVPGVGDNFNLACMAGSIVSNGPPLVAIATNDVSLQATY